MSEKTRTARSGRMIAAAVVLGLMGSGALVWQASSAAFTASTDNAGNSWTSGKVVLTDNKTGTALFTATNLVPGSTGNNCIEVTYNGSVASSVKLYGTTPTGTLAPYLNLVVEVGSGTSCASPGAYTSAFNDTLDVFATTKTNYATGVGTWTPSTAGTTRPYKFTYTLANDNNAQDKTAAGVKFIWEAQNT